WKRVRRAAALCRAIAATAPAAPPNFRCRRSREPKCSLDEALRVDVRTCAMNDPSSIVPIETSELLRAIRARTPARILVGRAGPSYRTATQLELRRDHAAALDAVHAEVEMERDLGVDLVRQFRLFEVRTRAESKEQYLLRPD